MNILITGGAGYIGSHVVKQLLEETIHNITILDNLSSGSLETLETLKEIRNLDFIELDLKEFEKIDSFLQDNNFDLIFHFAASIIVSESVANPLKYYMNNTLNTTNLVACAIKNNINKFIFSSTAAVYGEPVNIQKDGVDENYPTNPINPYGMSKLMSEIVLEDSAKAHKNFKFVIFRYFNVAGADIYYKDKKLTPRIGQIIENASHLIKVASEVALGIRDKIVIFGDDYDTVDGTGVRDYIHVDDLASAHIKAIEYLNNENNKSDIFNIGYGNGFSVKAVIESMKKIANSHFSVDVTNRRDGDPAIVIANNSKIKIKMNWISKYNNLDLICKSAYEWEKSRL